MSRCSCSPAPGCWPDVNLPALLRRCLRRGRCARWQQMRRKTDEAAALRALADAHSAVLWRYVVHLTGDHAGADDVVQETLLRAWRSPAILAQPPESTRAWMFTVARHLVIDEVRSARKRHELTDRRAAGASRARQDRRAVRDPCSSKRRSARSASTTARSSCTPTTAAAASPRSPASSRSPRGPSSRGCTTDCARSGSRCKRRE